MRAVLFYVVVYMDGISQQCKHQASQVSLLLEARALKKFSSKETE